MSWGTWQARPGALTGDGTIRWSQVVVSSVEAIAAVRPESFCRGRSRRAGKVVRKAKG